jgi:hypothetical protein
LTLKNIILTKPIFLIFRTLLLKNPSFRNPSNPKMDCRPHVVGEPQIVDKNAADHQRVRKGEFLVDEFHFSSAVGKTSRNFPSRVAFIDRTAFRVFKMNQALFDFGSDAFVDDDVDAVISARDVGSSGFDGAIESIFLECPARRA